MRRKTRHSRDLEREDLDKGRHVKLEDDRGDVADEADNDTEQTTDEAEDTINEAEDGLQELSDDASDVLEELGDGVGRGVVEDVEDTTESSEDELE